VSILPPQLYYLHLRTVGMVLYLHFIRYFNFRRAFAAILYLFIVLVMSILIMIFRLADEIFFPAYRKIKIKAPVYIISNPRSGTTLLHRLMCMDEERFVFIRTYHSLIPSITFSRLVSALSFIDRRIGQPIHKLFMGVEKLLFTGWKDIHPIGFNRPEEDEGLYFMAGISPAITLVTPFLAPFREIGILDQLPPKKLERIKQYYKATLQRWMFVLGPEKQFLCKSVMSTGRLRMLLALFPDASIIYPVRNPYETCPSFVAMFSSTWKWISPGIPEDSAPYRELAWLAIRYYQYFQKQKTEIPAANLITLQYDDLVNDPFAAIKNIYSQLHFDLEENFAEKLKTEAAKTMTYKSKHEYSLEQYGIQKEDIHKALPFVFEEYGFGASEDGEEQRIR
jgi:hypothetical protein